MRTVYKYQFEPFAAPIEVPDGDVVLVDYENDGSEVPTVWIDHEVGAPTIKLVMVGTGHQITSTLAEHVGSARCGRFVWHIYKESVS